MIYFRDKNENARIGNKAKGLVRLCELGFDVPEFFVVCAGTDITTAEFVSRLNECAESLDCTLFAVRSSGESEDGEQRSYAGQYDTVLDVEKPDLLAAIARVIASANGNAARDYSADNVERINVGMAVIVQKQIRPDFAGVLFTSSPFNPNELIIERVSGSGDKLVSGRAAPLRKVYKKDENAENEIDRALMEAAAKIESSEGKPMDAEFCYDGRLRFLQLRPQTVLPFDVDTDKDWRMYVNRNFCPLVHSVQANAAMPDIQNKLFGFSLPIYEGLIVAGREFYTPLNDKKCAEVWESLDRDGFFEEFAANVERSVKRTKKRAAAVARNDYSAYSDRRLIGACRKEIDRYTESYVPMMLRPDEYLFDKLCAAAGEKTGRDLVAALSYMTPSTYYSREHESFLRAALAGEPQKYIDEYRWYGNPLALDFAELTPDDFEARAKSLTPELVQKTVRAVARAKAEAIKRYGDIDKSPEITRLCLLIKRFIYLRTYTAENSDRYFYFIRTRLLPELARRNNTTVRALLLSRAEELTATVPSAAEQKKRASGEAVEFFDGGYKVHYGAQAYSLLSKLLPPVELAANGRVCRGDIACGGETTAKAAVVSSFAEAKTVERGCIIVTSMTTPEISSALENAAGIITDEGGITCHAAIVAREYGVPCLVGTRIATRTIKSGMTVKLDCINGYFEII